MNKQNIVSNFENSSEFFKRQDLPPDLFSGINISKQIEKASNYSIFDILKNWISLKTPTLISKQDCKDVISDTSDANDKYLHKELLLGSKLALIAYSLPGFFKEISDHFHYRNATFMDHFNGYVAEYSRIATNNMDDILEGNTNFIQLPDQNQLSGFYIRTPIRVWNKDGKLKQKIPSWKNRSKLLKYFVLGNTNVYVLRQNLPDHKYELFVLFRGTSNEFNGIPQYGDKFKNTQVFRYPEYEPFEEKFYKGGSTTKSLFYFYYMEMVKDVQDHIYQTLDYLGVNDQRCKRVVVSGHSMGGALTISFAHMCKINKPDIWDKCEFRSYAAPYCCNDAAIKQLEGWVQASLKPYKFIEVVNTDDFVNVQYKLGGQDAIDQSITKGVTNLITWLVDSHFDKFIKHRNNEQETFEKALRIAQMYPDIAMSAFLSGATEAQKDNFPTDKKIARRMGTRSKEIKMWGSNILTKNYNRTLNLVFCKRRINWENEYPGKSHINYVDVNMKVFWSLLRSYENDLYKEYSTVGLGKKCNSLRIVGLFNQSDKVYAKKILENYNVPIYNPSSKLKQLIAEK
jgi:hypothetical protein